MPTRKRSRSEEVVLLDSYYRPSKRVSMSFSVLNSYLEMNLNAGFTSEFLLSLEKLILGVPRGCPIIAILSP